jgi:uncharacterized protein involved in response to NO
MILFALGFRPFFFLAAIFAVLFMAQWVLTFAGGREFASYYGTIGWHSHEMLFGYTMAVIAGFLLTAVRNWTEIQTPRGVPLAAMVVLWLAGRLVPFALGILPRWLIASVDLTFIPVLAIALSIPLLRKRQSRNLIFLPLLAGFFLANLLIHLQMTGSTVSSARAGTFLCLDLILLLIVIIGGRVIPFFTERALAGTRPAQRTAIEWSAPAATVLYLRAELIAPDSVIFGALAGLAAITNAARLAGWYTQHVWEVPLLWVLHVGYGWLVAGFVLKSLGALGLIPMQFTVHAFTVGAIGVLTVGMMARVSLGHTGRPLRVGTPMTVAFALMNLPRLCEAPSRSFFPRTSCNSLR